MMKVSVIIPVYNGHDYIGRAIESVINQKHTDWELIIVDDCSTDDTYKICISYATKHKNIVVYRHEKNQGAGVTRQTGLKYATGEFVTFLDSDDYLKPDFLEATLILQSQHNADIVYTSFIINYPQQKVDKKIPAGDYIMSGTATVQLYYWNETKFLTGKLIRRSICNTIRWSNKRIGEDCQTLYFLLFNSQQVRSSSYAGYVHVFRPGSLLADKPWFYCFCGSTKAQFEIVEFLKEEYDKLDDKTTKYAKEVEQLYDFECKGLKKNFKGVRQMIKSGQISSRDVEINKADWKFIQEKYKKIIDYKI